MQVGGYHSDLLEHIAAVKGNGLFGPDIDFKLAKSQGPESKLATKESHFDILQVTICKVRLCLCLAFIHLSLPILSH